MIKRYIRMSEKKLLIVVFIILSLIMVGNALIELNQNKKDLNSMLSKQSHSLIESIMVASRNTTNAISYIDLLVTDRAIDQINFFDNLVRQNSVNDQELADLCRSSSIARLFVFNESNKLIFSPGIDDPEIKNGDFEQEFYLKEIFEKETDTLDFGTFRDEDSDQVLFAYALRTASQLVIYIEIDVTQQVQHKRIAGFGTLIKDIAKENDQIQYIVFQDTNNILAASGSLSKDVTISDNPFIQSAFKDTSVSSRKIEIDSKEIYETVHPFMLNGNVKGLIRIGLSTEEIEEINSRVIHRLIIVALVLILLGFVIVIYLFQRNEFSSLKLNYQVIESYSALVLDNVSDVIILYDDNKQIIKANKAASLLFNKVPEEKTLLDEFLTDQFCRLKLDEIKSEMIEVKCMIGNVTKDLLISRSSFQSEQQKLFYILVIKDLTELSRLREKSERADRLTAMGELAAGVAHEIRNPLNSISTIAQQLGKDFEPVLYENEYKELVGIIYTEVNRINATVKDFLRFARPEPIHPEDFELGDFFQSIALQYKSTFENLNIRFLLEMEYTGIVCWDRNQMKQVFINLIQNSLDVLSQDGIIRIVVLNKDENSLEIIFSDNGPGFDEKSKKQLFNLYFTTKPQGTGIGLSIVQRIIFEHGGNIMINPELEEGATFSILIPRKVSVKRN